LILTAQDTTNSGLGITNTNLVAGIAFNCNNWQTSKAVIGETWAHNLFGKGTMYLKNNEGIRKLQGSFMPPEEIVDRLKHMNFKSSDKYNEVKFEISFTQKNTFVENPSSLSTVADYNDKRLVGIVEMIVKENWDSLSNRQLKKHLESGYDVANGFMLSLENLGIININKPR